MAAEDGTVNFLNRGNCVLNMANSNQFGKKNPNWKGGFFVTNKGYKMIRSLGHHRANKGYVFEHILVAEKKLKRKILKNEIVHHINKNRLDNRSENLKVMERGKHQIKHRKGSKLPKLIGNTNGFKKGNVPWNKGLTGIESGFKGHYHTKKSKIKMSETKKMRRNN